MPFQITNFRLMQNFLPSLHEYVVVLERGAIKLQGRAGDIERDVLHAAVSV